MKFTIGFIEHNNEVFDKYLKPSLNNLNGEFELITTSDQNKPSINYNTILNKSNNQFVILTHQDITFSSDLLESIENTISKNNNFGVLGLVGVDSQRNYKWSDSIQSYEVETLDCCFVVVNKNNNIFFDNNTFDDFHLYVEDFCLQTKKNTGKKPYTLQLKTPNSFIRHHSHTLNKLGPNWGRYIEYRKRFTDRWGYVKTT